MSNWYDPNRYRSGGKGDYTQYDKDVSQAFVSADADGDGIISKSEYKNWDNQVFDIIGDNHAPFRKGKWDQGAARQRALLAGLTRNNLKLEDSSVLAGHGVWRDQTTGDLYGATPYKVSQYGRNIDDTLSSYVGGYKKDDENIASTGYDYSDWGDEEIPVYKYSYQGDWVADEADDPVITDCPDGQIRGVSGDCIEEKEYADNPWEEPDKTPRELKDKREDWDANWDPTRDVDDPSELGSIPYWTPTMTSIAGSSTKYKPSITEGKFNRYIGGNDYDHSKEQIESVLRAAGYRGERSY